MANKKIKTPDRDKFIELPLIEARSIHELLCTYETYDFHDQSVKKSISQLCKMLEKKIHVVGKMVDF